MEKNSKRVALVFMSNLYLINPKQVKSIVKKKSFIEDMTAFFEIEDTLIEEEFQELEKALKVIYSD